MNYYKVVRWKRCYLYSATEVNPIQYRIEKWVYPLFGRLFVFGKTADAYRFIDCDGFRHHFCLYSCEVQRARPQAFIADTADLDVLAAFWEVYEEHQGHSWATRAPLGTYTCDAVKLLRRIL